MPTGRNPAAQHAVEPSQQRDIRQHEHDDARVARVLEVPINPRRLELIRFRELKSKVFPEGAVGPETERDAGEEDCGEREEG